VSGDADYAALVDRVRAAVRSSVPRGARVLVVSRGDGNLLGVAGRDMAHFPQSPTGLYAGYYPASGAEAAAHLGALRARGATHLVIPATALWWLGHYSELETMLAEECQVVSDVPGMGVIFGLAPTPAPMARPGPDEIEAAATAPQASALVSSLLAEDAGVVVVGPAAAAVDVAPRGRWLVADSNTQLTLPTKRIV
jgi:hypothetical protein